MSEEHVFLLEAHFANIALKRTFVIVDYLVLLKTQLPKETLVANFAFERSLGAVGGQMRFQIAISCETFRTDFAFERTFADVNLLVI